MFANKNTFNNVVINGKEINCSGSNLTNTHGQARGVD